MNTGTYEEPLPCGGKLTVSKTAWQISYYFPGSDMRHKGTFVSVPGNSVEQYISAFNDNWTEYVQLKATMPKGGEFSKDGKMGMSIRIGDFAQGVCLRSYYMPIISAHQLEKVISGYRYAAYRAPQIQKSLASEIETIATMIIDLPIREEASGNFIILSDGTVTDTHTGLMWMRCALGQTWDGAICVGEAQRFTWDEAMAQRHDFAGYDDWRLPDVDELKSIIDKTRGRPAIDASAFPNTANSNFWSGSLLAHNSNFAWGVYFDYGYASYDGRICVGRIRLVRGGQAWNVLNGDTTSKVIGSPVKEAHGTIQSETHKDANINVASAKPTVRAAIDFIRQCPELFAAEIAELRAFLGEPSLASIMAPVEVVAISLPEPQTLAQLIAWLATLEMVTVSDLRTRLLPLDLLPGAVIDDLNERALDLTGDLALEEDGEKFIIVREVLARVVAAW